MRRLALLAPLIALVLAAPTQAAQNPSLHRYQTGPHVRGLQWMGQGHRPSVYKIAFWHNPVNGVYDKRLADAVRNMKWRLGYPTTALDGSHASARFIGYLKGERRPFAYRKRTGERVIALQKKKYNLEHPPVSARVQTLVTDALYLIAHASLIGYTQDARRMQIVREQIRIPPLTRYVYEDCSSSVTGLYWLAAGGSSSTPHPAGLPDPNGYTNPPFRGYGYTGTQASSGRVVWQLGQPLSRLRPGDIIFYGGGFPHHHETMYLGNGRVFSHGTDTGPFDLPALYRSDAVGAHRYVN